MYIWYDGARVSTESQLGKELLKWERPYDYDPNKHPYPKMVYRAAHRPDGRRSVIEVQDSLFPVNGERGQIVVAGAAEQWSRRNQLTVNDESEHRKALEAGWRNTPQEAMEFCEARDNIVSNLTAERHYTDARMSEPAQREAEAADLAAGLKHVPSIPEQPKKRRGRPPKVKTEPTETV